MNVELKKYAIKLKKWLYILADFLHIDSSTYQ